MACARHPKRLRRILDWRTCKVLWPLRNLIADSDPYLRVDPGLDGVVEKTDLVKLCQALQAEQSSAFQNAVKVKTKLTPFHLSPPCKPILNISQSGRTAR